MAFQILTTKLFAPSARATLVHRARLLDLLEEASGVKLVLVSAPAGFGKTTLVSDWLTKSEVFAAWLSLSEEDRELKRFLSYVVAALQQRETTLGASTLGTSLLETLEAAHLPALDVLLAPLLNDLAELSEPVVLVLDDYHVIDSKEVDKALAFLLKHLPTNVRVVMTTREDPSFALSRFRARAELLELRANDLRFTASEATEFLNRVMGLSLSTDVIHALEARTEGWIAGLQMAALSMRGRDAAAFVDAFTGSHRFVLDYLAEEVLEGQAEDVRSFLLQTSVLGRLHADLCAAVTGHPDARGMLELLEGSNLFLLPLDNVRQWYRYHHLFAEVLRARLGDGEHLADLHVKASVWFEQRGFYAEAIHHALEAKDFGRAASIIERIGPDMRMHRQDAALFRWLEAFPDDFARNRPILSLDYANLAFAEGQLELAEGHLQNAERHLRDGALADDMVVANEAEFRVLPARIALSRATYAQAQGDAKSAATFAKAAFDLVADDNLMWRGGAAGILGLALWADGDLEGAYTTFSEAMTTLQKAGHVSEPLGGSLQLATIRVAQGRLSDALNMYEASLGLAEAQGEAMRRVVANLHVGLSEVYFERNQLERALEQLEKRNALGELTGLPENRYRFFVAAARLDAAQGDFEGALELLAEAERHYIRGIFPEVRPISALKVHVWLKQGRVDKALAWADKRDLSITDNLSYLLEFEHITFARVLLAQYRDERTAPLFEGLTMFLQRLLEAAEKGERGGSILHILILQALAYTQASDERALEVLERALKLAEPESHSRPFLEEGSDMVALLTQAKRDRRIPAYASSLLEAFETQNSDPSDTSNLAGASSPLQRALPDLLEPLTKRELEILELLAQGRSNKEISRELYRALETIKGHNRNIFSKLQAKNRTQAVAKARELGLL